MQGSRYTGAERQADGCRRVPESAGMVKAPTQADLEARIAQLERELAEAHDQQAATADLLRIISSAPTEL